MKQTIKPVLTILMLLVSAQVNAMSRLPPIIEPIKVLFAKTAGVSDAQALSMLDQINDLMQESNLSSRQFVNANTPSFVKLASTYIGSNYLKLLGCAEDKLEATRNQHNADIVLMLVSTLGSTTCGGTPPGLVNTFFVLSSQRQFGYAVVSNQCMLTNGLYPASHEVLHLLYAEHKLNDKHTNRPLGARDNHAATQRNFATAGATFSDCKPNYSTCSKFQNFMSEDGKKFSNGLPAGNSLHSNVKSFVPNTSWGVVAAYHPVPAPPSCSISLSFDGCNSYYPYVVTASLPGYTVTHMDMDYRNGTSGPWYGLFEGIFTCPGFNMSYSRTIRAILTTAFGISQCQTVVYPQNCNVYYDEPPFAF